MASNDPESPSSHATDHARFDLRRELSATALGLAEDAHYSGNRPAPSGHSDHYQLAFTYRGAFHWHAAGRKTLVDATRILFVAGGEDYAEDYPLPGGMASVVLTPTPEVIEDIVGVDYARLARHANFAAQVRPSMADTALLTQLLRRSEGLAAEELMLILLRKALRADFEPEAPGARGRHLVDRAREYLHAQRNERIGLADIAAHVGVSAVYLIQLFKAIEGLPLYQYQLQLRLRRALLLLPDSDDITGIALDLGFSSHSHFTSAFRRVFGVTPSDFRCRLRSAAPAPQRHAGAPPPGIDTPSKSSIDSTPDLLSRVPSRRASSGATGGRPARV